MRCETCGGRLERLLVVTSAGLLGEVERRRALKCQGCGAITSRPDDGAGEQSGLFDEPSGSESDGV